MSKAILIIDMPKSCLDCWLSDNEYGDCVAVNFIKKCNYETRPEWCPLKPYKDYIPKKWINNYVNHKASKGFTEIDCYWQYWEDDVLKMIDNWEKENETN